MEEILYFWHRKEIYDRYFVVWNAFCRDHNGLFFGNNAGGYRYHLIVFERGGDTLHYHVRNHVCLDGADADRTEGRTCKENRKAVRTRFKAAVSGNKKGNAARGYMVTNMVANLLGLGWAATPAGLKAMQELQKQNPHPEKATTGMCTFLIVNISSLQLIPVNIIAYRSQFQSVRPAGIVAAGLLATTCSTLAGILFSVVARKIAEKKETLKCR